jgi:hypothetical protein
MQPGDSALAQRLGTELQDRIQREMQALVKNPSERSAGHIQGLQDALALLEGGVKTLDERRAVPPTTTQRFT